jgi:hypothetical protein
MLTPAQPAFGAARWRSSLNRNVQSLARRAGAAGGSMLPGVKRARQRDRNPRTVRAHGVELASASGSWRRLTPAPSAGRTEFLGLRARLGSHSTPGNTLLPAAPALQPGHYTLAGSPTRTLHTRRLSNPDTTHSPARRPGHCTLAGSPTRALHARRLLAACSLPAAGRAGFLSSAIRMHICDAHPHPRPALRWRPDR